MAQAQILRPRFTLMQAVEARKPDVQPDPASWVDEHGNFLFRYAAVRLRDDNLAEDLVQETLLSAIESAGSYNGKSAERTWLTAILKHKIVDHYRKSLHETPIGPDESDLSAFDRLFTNPRWEDHWNEALVPTDWGRDPESALRQAEFYSTLEGCMAKLPKRVAGVFVLRELDGYDTDELCQLLDLSANNIWTMMYRARMSLRKCIESNWFSKTPNKS